MRSSVSSLSRRIAGGALVAVLVVSGFATSPAASAPAAGSPAADEPAFLSLFNQARTDAGLPPFENDPTLGDTSRAWSAEMSSRNQLSHDPNLAADATAVDPGWRSLGENVGSGYDVRQLNDAFMASPAHRANILSTRFNRVGIGVVYNGTKLWVTVRFLEGPALTASAAPAQTPPGVRTVLTGDFDGDGRGDMLTYGPGVEADELWFGRADQTLHKVPVSIKGQYQPVAGDFDGNGRTDILWYAPGAATDSLWTWNGSAWTTTTKAINGRYTARAGDFDADGVDDILWYAPGDAADFMWFGNRSGAFTSVSTTASGTFIPVVGDFDGDGGDDVFWYARGPAPDVMWYSTGQRGQHRSAAVTAGGSHTPFAGDFDGNGVDDIFFYTPGPAADSTWFNTASTLAGTRVSRSVDGAYVPAAIDVDGNGVDDAIWFSPSGAAGDPLWWGARATTTYRAATVSVS